jgi:hypothetical protein
MGCETPRYETFPDPIDNWIVWDNEEDAVAILGTEPLWSLMEAEAHRACDLLNELTTLRAA